MMPNSRTPDILSRAVLFLSLAAVYPRLYFGLEFFDEAYYLALPVSFSLGYQPFLEENAVHQFAALMIQPFFNVYLFITGSNEGVVLFGRHLYLACGLLSVWAVRNFWTRAIGERVGNLLAAVAITYVPLCVISLSYNSLTYFGLLAGSALLASAALGHHTARNMFLGTLCMAGVTFAYPSMLPVGAVAIAVGLAGAIATGGQGVIRTALIGTAAAAFGSLAVGVITLLILDLPGALDAMLEFSQAQGAQGGGAAKLKAVGIEFWFQARLFGAIALALVIVSAGVMRSPNSRISACAAALLWPALAFASTTYNQFHAPFTTVPFVLSIIGLGAPLFVFLLRKQIARPERIGITLITSISMLATVGILWSTANGLRNASIGLTPAALVALSCLAIWVTRRGKIADRQDNAAAPDSNGMLPFTVLVVSLLCFQVHQLWTHAYREFVPSELEQTVDRGAFKGIKTTSLKILFMKELEADLAQARGDARTVIFFDYFPAGYLMSDLKPRTPGLWFFPNSRTFQGTARLRDVYAKRLQNYDAAPDLVVKMICIPARPFTWMKLPEADVVSALFEAPEYETVIERPCYTVAKRRLQNTAQEWSLDITE
jgi:hypothetical protein